MPNIEIAALYHFIDLPNFQDLQKPLKDMLNALGIKGILLVAHEGINGTIAGTPENLPHAIEGIQRITGIENLEYKLSYADSMPFLRMKVRLKQEIVTIGDPSVSPLKAVGTYVEPENWNALLQDPEVVVLDTRNDYEYRIGTFKNAIDPKTESFREFPAYVRENLDPAKNKKIAMFCTGGIRCEKASAFMLQEGFEEVYHLKGGILKYLERIPEEESLWDGACFVFDQRVAVEHGLKPAPYAMCYGCREPLSQADCAHPDYELGVSCPHCASTLTAEQKASARERQKQVELAAKRGGMHLGEAPQQGAKFF